jgi:hypothetical protein
MQQENQPGAGSKFLRWTGIVISALPVLALCFSASMKFTQSKEAMEGFAKFEWKPDLLVPLGIVELACALLYVIPQTAVFGAILVTGYLGGAVATHVRINDAFAAPIIVGVLAWVGLWLRSAQIRSILPWWW